MADATMALMISEHWIPGGYAPSSNEYASRHVWCAATSVLLTSSTCFSSTPGTLLAKINAASRPSTTADDCDHASKLGAADDDVQSNCSVPSQCVISRTSCVSGETDTEPAVPHRIRPYDAVWL